MAAGAATPRHALSVQAAARTLDLDPVTGLSATEAAGRFGSLGRNRLVDPPPDPAWKALARQFNAVLIRVLIGAGILSGVLGDTNDVVVITAVIVLNAVVGFPQERRAEAALLALKRMLATNTPVRRDRRTLHVPSEQIVRGDVITLEPGERTPPTGASSLPMLCGSMSRR